MAGVDDSRLASFDAERQFVREVALDYGYELFDFHVSGMRIPEDGVAVLKDAADCIKQLPSWTVVLEGHCPGRPEDNGPLRMSIGEEAADVCKEHLERDLGVVNRMVCSGIGSAQGRGGILVHLFLVAPEKPEAIAEVEPPEEEIAAAAVEDAATNAALAAAEAAIAACEAVASAAAAVASAAAEAMVVEAAAAEAAVAEAAAAEAAAAEAAAEAEVAEAAAADAAAAEAAAAEAAAAEAAAAEAAATEAVAEQCAAEALSADVTVIQPGASVRKDESGAEVQQDAAELSISVPESLPLTVQGPENQTEEICASVDAGELSLSAPQEQLPATAAPGSAGDQDTAVALAGAPRGDTEASLDMEDMSLTALLAQVDDEPSLPALVASQEKAPSEPEAHLALLLEGDLPVGGDTITTTAPAAAADVLSPTKVAAELEPAVWATADTTPFCDNHQASAGTPDAAAAQAELPQATAVTRHTGPSQQPESLAPALPVGQPAILLPESPKAAPELMRADTILPMAETLPQVGALISAEKTNFAEKAEWVERQALLTRAETATFNPPSTLSRDNSPARKAVRLETESAPVEVPVPEHIIVPDVRSMTPQSRKAMLEESVLNAMPITFKPNSTEITAASRSVVAKIAGVLRAFPDTGIKCVGHSKGRPSDNNASRHSLSLARANSVRQALYADGARNQVLCMGLGTAFGCGTCVRFHALGAAEVERGELDIPLATSMVPPDLQRESLDQLLKESLEMGVLFEPNRVRQRAESEGTVRQVASVLRAFPRWTVVCEGHAKGQAADDTAAKRQLSQVRAEVFGNAVKRQGVTNSMRFIGCGCSMGLGACVRMYAEAREEEVEIPDISRMSVAEQRRAATERLEKILAKGIEFQPNKWDVPPSAAGVVSDVAKVLKGFPNLTFLCEGHSKGTPDDNNDARIKLSRARAEALYAAAAAEGATNRVVCKGEGSSLGRGAFVRIIAIDPAEAEHLHIPDTEGMSRDERVRLANELLDRAVERNIEFDPNAYDIPTSGLETIRTLARVMGAFPDFTMRCEGHAKGTPADDNEAKRRLSLRRAEAVRAGVRAAGAPNGVRCVGMGSSQGLGMRVRMVVMDDEETQQFQLDIPDTSTMSREQRVLTVDALLEQALEANISFEPNRARIPPAGKDTVEAIARVLNAFADIAMVCEGHTKGRPEDNSDARVHLSQVRAEAVVTALREEGVTNAMTCIGRGSEEGRGMRICIRCQDAGV